MIDKTGRLVSKLTGVKVTTILPTDCQPRRRGWRRAVWSVLRFVFRPLLAWEERRAGRQGGQR